MRNKFLVILMFAVLPIGVAVIIYYSISRSVSQTGGQMPLSSPGVKSGSNSGSMKSSTAVQQPQRVQSGVAQPARRTSVS